GDPAERFPRLDRHRAIGFRGEAQDDLGGVDVAVDPSPPVAGPGRFDRAVELLQESDLRVGLPADALATIAERLHQRPERGEPGVGLWVVALDDGDRWHGLAGDRLALAVLPVGDVEGLRQLGRRVVQDWGQHDVALAAKMTFGNLREFAGDPLVD